MIQNHCGSPRMKSLFRQEDTLISVFRNTFFNEDCWICKSIQILCQYIRVFATKKEGFQYHGQWSHHLPQWLSNCLVPTLTCTIPCKNQGYIHRYKIIKTVFVSPFYGFWKLLKKYFGL